MRILRILFVPMMLLSVFADPSDGGDWPQFLGPNRNGVSDETQLTDTFPADGATVVWRQPLGPGMSGVAISGGTAFTLYQNETHQLLVAMDAQTGEKQWEEKLAPAYENAMGNGPRATPTVHDGMVYAYTGEGILVAADAATGQQIWSANGPKALYGKIMDYGMASSPLIVAGNVVVQVGSHRGAVAAFDIQSGKLAWNAAAGNAGYSSPIVTTLAGKQQVVALIGQKLIGIEPADGEVLWTYEYATDYDCNTATPVSLGDSKLLISAGENHGATILTIAESDGTYTATADWESLGNDSVLRAEWQTPVIHDGHLYALDNKGSAGPITNMVCIRMSDHKQLWAESRFGKANFILADGKLFVSTMRGDLMVVKATPESFQVADRAVVLGMTRQAPAIANGLLYLRDDNEVVCVDVRQK